MVAALAHAAGAGLFGSSRSGNFTPVQRLKAVGSLPELEPTPWDLAATNKIAAAIRQEEDYMAIRRPVAADVMERYGDSLLLSTQFYS